MSADIVESPSVGFLRRPSAVSLRENSVRGGAATLIAEALNHVIRVMSIVVLARYVSPEQFGLLAMVTALTVVAERFKDLGLDVATIQRDSLTHEQVSNLFWINTGIGATIMLVVAGSAPLVVGFYGEPRLWEITIVVASTFLFGGATIQHQALMRRQMRFKTLAWINVTSSLLGFAAAVLLAVAGFGYWALVWRELVRAVATAVTSWLLFPWRPSLPGRVDNIDGMVRMGGSVTMFNLLYFLSRNLDQVLIGRMWGATQLGFYRQAHQLVMLPLSMLQFPVNAVALPALSALKNEPERYRRYYREIIGTLSFISMPIVLYLAMHSEMLISIALGDSWLPTADIFRLMAFAGFAWPLICLTGPVMTSFGHNRQYVWLGVGNAVTLTLAFAVGSRWGAMGTAVAFAWWTYLTVLPILWFSLRNTPVSLTDSLAPAIKPAIATFSTYAITTLAFNALQPMDNLTALVVSLPAFCACYLLVWTVQPGGRAVLVRYFGYAAMSARARTI